MRYYNYVKPYFSLYYPDYSEFFDPQKVKLPTTEDEVVQIVKAASIDGHQVRVLGAGHSRNSLAYSKDILISLIHYRGIVNLDRNSQQVRISYCFPVQEGRGGGGARILPP